MLTREKELLLALVEYVRKSGHDATCVYHTNTSRQIACSCGYQDVLRAADYFNRNEPV